MRLPLPNAEEARRVFIALMEEVEGLEQGCSTLDVKPIFGEAIRKLAASEVSALGDRVVEKTGLSHRTIAVMIREMRSFHDEHGFVGDIETAAHCVETTLHQGYASVVFSGEKLFVYDEAAPAQDEGPSAVAQCHYHRHERREELDEVIRGCFAGLPLVQSPQRVKQIRQRVLEKVHSERFFDDAPAGLNVANGFIRVSAGGEMSLEAHSPEHRARYKLPVVFDLDAPPDEVDALFSLTIDSVEARLALQEAVGATLFNLTALLDEARHIVLLVGAKRSGKSTAANILRGLMAPTTVVSVPPELWTNEYHRATLDGALLNVVTEVGSTIPLSAEHVKMIASCEVVSARLPYGSGFHFQPRAYHWFAANTLPRVTDKSDAFDRRLLIIKFDRSLRDNEIEGGLVGRILASPSPFIVWAAAGAARLMQAGRFTLPSEHGLHSAVMQHGQDCAAILAQVGLEAAQGCRLTSVDLRAAMVGLADRLGQDGWAPTDGDMKRLVGEMRRRFGAERHKSVGAPFYTGVRFRAGFGPAQQQTNDPDTLLGL